MLKIETRALLASRYLSPRSAHLTHLFRVRDTEAYASLCGVQAASAADTDATDTTAAPTCPKCLKARQTLDLSCYLVVAK